MGTISANPLDVNLILVVPRGAAAIRRSPEARQITPEHCSANRCLIVPTTGVIDIEGVSEVVRNCDIAAFCGQDLAIPRLWLVG
jgi:hypothetical protein